jgi:hypothetical protein
MATKITGTNTAAAPGVTGDDTDTGLFYGTNEIGFSTGGTSRLTLDSSGDLKFPDSGKLVLGTDNDLKMYHDGSHSRIVDSGTGNLMLQSDRLVIADAGNSENQLVCQSDGAVELFHNGIKKLETSSSGIIISGGISQTGYLDIESDSSKLRLGASQDLEIFHNGTDSRIINAGSDLYFYTTGDHDVKILADSQNAVICKPDAAVEIYFDNTKKVETSSTGATVSGSIIADNTPGKNLIINGAMQVAQRGTSNTNDQQGYQTVDRWKLDWSGADSIIEQHQGTLTSSDTGPWEEGFRKEYHLVNGNQSSGAGATDYCQFSYRPEGQDIAQSGWNYNSTSSYITLSFWVKSSVGQNFYGFIENASGSRRIFGFETGTLTANTWKKVTVSIPGTSGLTIPNDNTAAFYLVWTPFYGTAFTSTTGRDVGQWYTAYNYTPDNTSTWWTTDNATFQLTGVQLEVGSAATNFEHRLYGEELARCQRYFEVYYMNAGTGGLTGLQSNGTNHENSYQFKVQKRAQPTGALMGNASWSTATPNFFTSVTECGFHNGSSWFQLSDGSQDASLSFSAEL